MYIYIFFKLSASSSYKEHGFSEVFQHGAISFHEICQTLCSHSWTRCSRSCTIQVWIIQTSSDFIIKPRDQSMFITGGEWKIFGRSHGFLGTGGGISRRQRSLKEGGRTVENWLSIEGGGEGEVDHRNITEPWGGGGHVNFILTRFGLSSISKTLNGVMLWKFDKT